MGTQLPQPSVSATSVDLVPGTLPDVPELTRAMASGSEAAYRSFYDAYYDRLWRYLLVVSQGQEDSAAEALQATLVRVVRHIKIFPSDEVLWRWLTVLARTALADQNRKRWRYLAFLDRFTIHVHRYQFETEQPDLDQKLCGMLQDGLAALAEDERSLLERKYFEGRSVRDLAQELKSTEKAVESRLTRARGKLKGLLVKALGNE